MHPRLRRTCALPAAWGLVVAFALGSLPGCGGPGTAGPPSGRSVAEVRAAAAPTLSPAADSLRDLYASGRTFGAFLEATRSRRDQWHAHYRDAAVPDSLLARARAVGGTWRILAVAEDWCGDSANTIPYLARLVEGVPGLEMRIVDSRRGRGVMQAHRTPDGRPSTPTVVLFDGAWREVGALVERPTPLVSWVEGHRTGMSSEALHEHIYAWYDEDRGVSTIAQVVTMMEQGPGTHIR